MINIILNFPINFVISKWNEAKRSGMRNLLMLPYKQNGYISPVQEIFQSFLLQDDKFLPRWNIN